MNRTIPGIALLLGQACQLTATANDEDSPPVPAALVAARQLIRRVLPGQTDSFAVELMPAANGRDVLEIEAKAGKIVLRGNNGLSVAMAFSWYLRHEAKTNFDWQAVGPLEIPGALPSPPAKIHQECPASERFFLNCCTYGYTMPWWNRQQWERFIDWMAMNGINRPLLQCGQEAVWLEVRKSYGLHEDRIRAYFAAPPTCHGTPWPTSTNGADLCRCPTSRDRRNSNNKSSNKRARSG